MSVRKLSRVSADEMRELDTLLRAVFETYVPMTAAQLVKMATERDMLDKNLTVSAISLCFSSTKVGKKADLNYDRFQEAFRKMAVKKEMTYQACVQLCTGAEVKTEEVDGSIFKEADNGPTNELAAMMERRMKVERGEDIGPRVAKQGPFNMYTEYSEFTRTELKEYHKKFKAADTGGDGFIDFEELKKMMEKLGEPQTHLGLKAIMKEVDEDLDGLISLKEFLEIFRKARNGTLTIAGLEKLAQSINVDEVGVKGAKSFFEQKMKEANSGSEFEKDILAEREAAKQKADDDKKRRADFKSRQSNFGGSTKDVNKAAAPAAGAAGGFSAADASSVAKKGLIASRQRKFGSQPAAAAGDTEGFSAANAAKEIRGGAVKANSMRFGNADTGANAGFSAVDAEKSIAKGNAAARASKFGGTAAGNAAGSAGGDDGNAFSAANAAKSIAQGSVASRASAFGGSPGAGAPGGAGAEDDEGSAFSAANAKRSIAPGSVASRLSLLNQTKAPQPDLSSPGAAAATARTLAPLAADGADDEAEAPAATKAPAAPAAEAPAAPVVDPAAAAELHARLSKYYLKYNPENMDKIAGLAEKYVDSVSKLDKQMSKKYGQSLTEFEEQESIRLKMEYELNR
jgi:Ca2+-binding EF-hand superfamily protein